MIYRINLSKSGSTGNQAVLVEVTTYRELLAAEKLDFHNAALAVLERNIPATEQPAPTENIGVEPCYEENELQPMAPSIEELVREIHQNGLRHNQGVVVTIRCITADGWQVTVCRDANILIHAVTATNLRGALAKMLEYQRSHQPARTEAKEDDWCYLTYLKSGKYLLHGSCFENVDDAVREANRMHQRNELKEYAVNRAREVPACANTAQCPCCKNNVLDTSMTAASFTDPEKYCIRCLPLIRRAHEIDSKRTSSKVRDLLGDNGPFSITYPNKYDSETLLHETSYPTLQEAHDAGSFLIKNKVISSYTVLRESDVPNCANTRYCPRCKRNVLYNRVRSSSKDGQPGCDKCLITE